MPRKPKAKASPKKASRPKAREQMSLDESDQMAAQNEEFQIAMDDLEESRNQYAELFHRAPIPYVTLNGRARIIQFNFNASLLLAKPGDGLDQNTYLTNLADGRAEMLKVLKHMQHCRDEEINVRTEVKLKTGKGETRFVELVSFPMPGQEQFYHTAIIDQTPQKNNEKELMRARDEAVAASHAKDQFLAALSHELRTPLNPVLLVASESAQDESLPENVRADFEMIRKNIELEARLIDDLLDLTRITHGKLALESSLADLHAILRDAFATVEGDIRQKKIAVEWTLAATPQIVVGDPVRLQQVFWNVLKNAVKFTPEQGKISIQTIALPDERAAVRITDSGLGMTPAELARVFSAFSQGDHAGDHGKHRFGGLGLGLAISNSLVKLHGGNIRAESKGRGKGATFVVEFPLAKIPQDGVVAPLAVAAKTLPVVEGLTSMRILLVEDHEPTRVALKFLLVRRNHQVCTAASLTEARTLAQTEKFDVLISDIGLPDGSGCDLMADFKTRYALQGIALTGYGMEEDIARTRQAGFTTHLVKPVRTEALENALNIASRARTDLEAAA